MSCREFTLKTIRVQVETNDGCVTIWYEKSKLKNPTESICKRVNEQLQGLNLKRVEVSLSPATVWQSDKWHKPLDFPPDLVHTVYIKQISQMRKIESQMNAAISNRQDWKSANTRVEFEQGNNISRVFLHGNKIAEVGDNFVRLFDGGWQSNTTKSRLNAILSEHGLPGERVFQRKFDWFVSQEGGEIPFFSGMRLNWIWGVN